MFPVRLAPIPTGLQACTLRPGAVLLLRVNPHNCCGFSQAIIIKMKILIARVATSTKLPHTPFLSCVLAAFLAVCTHTRPPIDFVSSLFGCTPAECFHTYVCGPLLGAAATNFASTGSLRFSATVVRVSPLGPLAHKTLEPRPPLFLAVLWITYGSMLLPKTL